MAVIKAGALYRQVAAEMRASIASGEWATGTQIPREDQLAELYDVSRPTVRQAVAELRAEGLLDVRQGRGSFVRDRDARNAVDMEQYVTRTGTRYATGTDQWARSQEPTTVRVRLDPHSAALLDLAEGEAAFQVECPLIHEASGTLAIHRMIMPMERITGTPLAKAAVDSVAKVYATLAAANGDLEWRETVTARMPNPDELTSLQLPEGVPLLISHRVTLAQADQRPLILETTTLGASSAQFAYAFQPTIKARTTSRAKPAN